MTDSSKLPVSLALQFAAWLVALLLAYGAMEARVQVVETKVESMKSDLAEIKGDVKLLIRRPLP
jgi:hypothetical protein